MSYAQLIDQLYQINITGSGAKFGLDNILKLVEALGNPHHQFQSIHIAGTNGKGSVVTKIAKALQLAGYKVGLYTSPHISSFRERIRINEKMISEKELEEELPPLLALVKKNQIPATFFEITTALALHHFAKNKVDVVVLETGIGGRLDTTNIVTPLLSIITSISLEHTEILGQTLEEITHEKGGIIKPRIPVLIGPRVPEEIIRKIANLQASPYFKVEGSYIHFDDENNAVAKKSLELLGDKFKIPAEAITKGLATKPPCRLEERQLDNGQKVIFDVAHNPDGLKHLFQSLSGLYPHKKFHVVFGLSKTKDIYGCMAALTHYGDKYYPIEAPNGRGISIEQLQQHLREFNVANNSILNFPTIEESMQKALENAFESGDVVVVCGTFFIMRYCREVIGIDEARDSLDINERTANNR